MAHVRKVDRPKPWIVSWRVHGKYRSRAFARKVDAEAFEASVEDAARNRGLTIDPHEGRVTLADWSEEWLRIAALGLKPKTLATYRSLLRSRIVPTFGSWPIAELGPGDVDSWIAGMKAEGLSPSRIRQAHVVLLAMLELAYRQNRIGRNVARGTKVLPKIRRREADYLDPATVDRLVTSAGRYGLFLEVQGVLGLRVGEAAALRRRSVDLLHKRINVSESLGEIGGQLVVGPTKTHAQRKVPLPPSIRRKLKAHLKKIALEPETFLFTTANGSPIRYRNFHARVWGPLLHRCGLPHYGLHVLRHSAAARMIKAGWEPKAVQSVLGHQSAAFTLTVYGHLFDDDLDALSVALDSISGGTEGVQALRPAADIGGESTV